MTDIGVASGGSKYVKSADLNQMDGAAQKSDNEMVDDALTGKKMEDQDDSDISYTQKGTGGNLLIQTDSGNIRLKCK